MPFPAQSRGLAKSGLDTVDGGCEILHQLIDGLSNDFVGVSTIQCGGAGFRWPIHSITSKRIFSHGENDDENDFRMGFWADLC